MGMLWWGVDGVELEGDTTGVYKIMPFSSRDKDYIANIDPFLII